MCPFGIETDPPLTLEPFWNLVWGCNGVLAKSCKQAKWKLTSADIAGGGARKRRRGGWLCWSAQQHYVAFVRCSPCCSYELSASSGVLGSDRVCPTLSRHLTPHPQASATVRNRPQQSVQGHVRLGEVCGISFGIFGENSKLSLEVLLLVRLRKCGHPVCVAAAILLHPFARFVKATFVFFCTFLPGRPSVHLTRRVASFASRIGTDAQRSHKVQITVRGRRVLVVGVVFGEYYTVWNVILRFFTVIGRCDFRFPQWYGCPWLWVISREVVHVSLARLSHKSVSQECFLRAQRSALLCPTRVSQKSSSKSILQEVDREHRTRVRKILVVAISQEQRSMFQQHAWPSVTTAIQSSMYSRLVMYLGSIRFTWWMRHN